MILRQTFGSRGAYEIDWVRYMQVAANALRDISSVLGKELTQHPDLPHEAAYALSVYVGPNLPNMPRLAFGGRRTKELVRQIVARIGYTVEFYRAPLTNYDLPESFRSWIVANFQEKHFMILYDGERIEAAAESLFEREKLLAKTLLHECAHGVLHSSIIEKMIQQGDMFPKLQPEHEQEAWLYAVLIWAVLVGDHAYMTRKHDAADKGWMLS